MHISIVITGSLRNQPHLEKVIDGAFAAMAASPNVGRICLSTTDEENSARQALKPWLDRPGFQFIHSHPPTTVVKGHRLHQLVQIENALQQLANDDWVLKLRTDKLILAPELLTRCIRLVESNETDYDSKFGVIEGHIFLPWYINDMAFFAQKKSLQSLVTLDTTVDRLAPHLATEQVIWSRLLGPKSMLFYHASKHFPQIYQYHPEAVIPPLANALKKTSCKLYRWLYQSQPGVIGKARLDCRFSEIEYILYDYWSILAERFFSMSPMLFENARPLNIGSLSFQSDFVFSRYGQWGASFSDVGIFKSLLGSIEP